MIKILPLDFLGVSHGITWKDKNAVYRLKISALVPEIFKFEKCVKYANEMTNDVIHSTQQYSNFLNTAILANLQHRPLKLGRLIVLQETHLPLYILCSHGNSLFSSSHPVDFNMLVTFSLKNFKWNHKLEWRYLHACLIVHIKRHKQISNGNAKCGQNSPYYEGGLEPSMLPW